MSTTLNVNVALGSYKIEPNLYNVPTAEDPYPEQYRPHAATEAGASAIEKNENLNSQQCDFQLPVALTSDAGEFLVLLPDGTPAREVHANIRTQMDGMFQWAGSVETALIGFRVRSSDSAQTNRGSWVVLSTINTDFPWLGGF
jgi:hypothetical protein